MFQPLSELRREFDRLFEDFSGFGEMGVARPYPPLNIWEDEDKLYAQAELPGFRMNDLEILVVGAELTIKGRRDVDEQKDWTYHRRERVSGEFARYVTLPVEVDADNVEATLKDGVLTITMPKSRAARARKITVKGA
jgi:HSP20 family protein